MFSLILEFFLLTKTLFVFVFKKDADFRKVLI